MGMLLSMAHRAMTRRFVYNTHESGMDISLDQWMVLGPIWQLKTPSHKDLFQRPVIRVRASPLHTLSSPPEDLRKRPALFSRTVKVGTTGHYTKVSGGFGLASGPRQRGC